MGDLQRNSEKVISTVAVHQNAFLPWRSNAGSLLTRVERGSIRGQNCASCVATRYAVPTTLCFSPRGLDLHFGGPFSLVGTETGTLRWNGPSEFRAPHANRLVPRREGESSGLCVCRLALRGGWSFDTVASNGAGEALCDLRSSRPPRVMDATVSGA